MYCTKRLISGMNKVISFVSENLVFFIVLFNRLKLVIKTERALRGLSNSSFKWPNFGEAYTIVQLFYENQFQDMIPLVKFGGFAQENQSKEGILLFKNGYNAVLQFGISRCIGAG